MASKRRMRSGVRALIYTLIVSTTMVCSLSGSGWAMLAPAAATDGQGYDRTADMKTVQTALESKIIRERLKAYGMTDKEIESRLSRLPDQQVHQLAKNIDTLSAGGDVGGILVIVLLVVLIIYLVHRL